MYPQLPPKRDETALQEEEELQLALALSQSEAEEKERMVSRSGAPLVRGRRGRGAPGCLGKAEENGVGPCARGPFLSLPQRQKSAYAAATYPKAEPAPVASSAPPASSLYSSPVVSACMLGHTSRARGGAGCPRKDGLIKPMRVVVQPGPHQLCVPGQGFPVGEEDTGETEDLPRVRGGSTPWGRRWPASSGLASLFE